MANLRRLWKVTLKLGLLVLLGFSLACSKRGSSNGDVANSTYGLKLDIVDGNDQKTMPGRLFTKPLVVKASNMFGEPVSGVVINFSVTSGEGFYITPTSVTTGPSGLAAVEVKGPDAYNTPGVITASLSGTPLTQTFTVSTNDSLPGVHFEIESTLGTTITAGQPFGFIVKLVNADGTLVDYNGAMTTIWNMQTNTSWSGLAPKNLLTTYSCNFVGGLCHTPSTGAQAIVLYDSRTPTTVFMGDGNSGYMDVFAYDITVLSDVPTKVVVADQQGGPAAGALVIADRSLTADTPNMNLAAAVTDASGNYLTDATGVQWLSTCTALSDYFSSTLSDAIVFTPTRTTSNCPGKYGTIMVQHPTYPLGTSGKIYVDAGQLSKLAIEKVGGGTQITAGIPFKIHIRAIDADGNTVGQTTQGTGSGFHGNRNLNFTASNFQSGAIPTGGDEPIVLLNTSLGLDPITNLRVLPGTNKTALHNSDFDFFFNFGEIPTLNNYSFIYFDATDVSPTLSVKIAAGLDFPEVTGSIQWTIEKGAPHHLMLRDALGAEGQSVCTIPSDLGMGSATDLYSLVLLDFTQAGAEYKRSSCHFFGSLSFKAGLANTLYYSVEDIAGNWIANVQGTYVTPTPIVNQNTPNVFVNSFTPTSGLSPSLTFTGTYEGWGGIIVQGDYAVNAGSPVTYFGYLQGKVSAAAFHHFDVTAAYLGDHAQDYALTAPNYYFPADRPLILTLIAKDEFENILRGSEAYTSGTVDVSVSPTNPLFPSPDGSLTPVLPPSVITLSTPPQQSSPNLWAFRIASIPNVATGPVTFNFTNATNGAPNRSITVTPIAGEPVSLDIATGPNGTGSSLAGMPIILSADESVTYYLSGRDSVGNVSNNLPANWSLPGLNPTDALSIVPTGGSNLFHPLRLGSADKIRVTHTYTPQGWTSPLTLTTETGPVTLTAGKFHHMAVLVENPGVDKLAGVPFNVTAKLKDQQGNTLTHINGPYDVSFVANGVSPTLLDYNPTLPVNGTYTFTNGAFTFPVTFYNALNTNPRLIVNATVAGDFGSGISAAGDIKVISNTLDHLHILSAAPNISAGQSNVFSLFAEDQWGNQVLTGVGSNMNVRIQLTNTNLATQDITNTTLSAPTPFGGSIDTVLEGTLNSGAGQFTVTSTSAGTLTVAASILSGETATGTNLYESLIVQPLTTIADVKWAPSQSPLSVHNASPTSPMISSTGALAAQVVDIYGNVITSENSAVIDMLLVGASQPWFAGVQSKTVVNGTATFNNLKYTKVESFTVRASLSGNPALYDDAPVTVVANGQRQTIIIMPGQTFHEGTGLEATAITGNPFASGNGTDIEAGQNFNVTVRLVDSAFNTVNQSGILINLVSTGGTTDPHITVTPSTNTLVGGVATFNITVKRQGAHRLTATAADGSGQLLATTYNVLPKPASKYVVLLPNQNLNEGAPDLTTAITNPAPVQKAGDPFNVRVVATDMYHNQIIAATGTTVTLTTTDPNDTHPSPQPLSNGETTFSVTHVTAGTGQFVSASGGAYTSTSSMNYAINPGNATQCIAVYPAPQQYNPGSTPYSNAVTGAPPSTIKAGTPFTVTTYAVDDYFNIDASYNGPVQLTTSDPSDTEPVATTFTNGIKALIIDPVSAGSGKILTLTCTGKTAHVPSPYTVNVGNKAYLVSYFSGFHTFDSSKGHQSLSDALPTQSSADRNPGTNYSVQVIATDSRYNIIDDDATIVTLTSTSGASNYTVDGPKPLLNGQASFNLTHFRAGTSYTVSAAGTSYSSPSSATFNVLTGAANKLLVLLPGENFISGRQFASEAASGTPYKQTVGYNYEIKVYATDSYYNLISSDNSTMITLSSTGGSFNYPAAQPPIPMAGGIATFTVSHLSAIPNLTILPSGGSYSGESSDPIEVLSALSSPTLSLTDGITNSATHARQLAINTAITNSATTVAWCLSESQNTRPVTGASSSNNRSTCNGTSGGGRDALGWYTSAPSSISLLAGDGLKTLYLWVADAANNVSTAVISDSITLDTNLPATPTVTFTGTHTNVNTPSITITGDTDAVAYCLFVQDNVTAAPTPPLFINGCWGAKPTTATMGAGGARKVYLFTKDSAENVSLASGGYSAPIYYDPTPPGAFTISGVYGNNDLTPDNLLGTTTRPTFAWGTASDSTTVTYSVVVKQAGTPVANCTDSFIGATLGQMPSTCLLSDGSAYTVEVSAMDQAGNITNATSAYAFTVDFSAPTGTLAISGATGGSDVTSDELLSNGNIVTANWNDIAGEDSYKITIYKSDNTTVHCAESTVPANTTSHTFTGCPLSYANLYYIRVVAWDAAGNSLVASNANKAFTVVPQAVDYLVELVTPVDQTAGLSIDLRLTARLAGGATDTSFTGLQSVAFTTTGSNGDNSICSSGSIITFEAPSQVTFTGGIGTANVKLKKAETGRTISASSTVGGVLLQGTTSAFNVVPNAEQCKRFLDGNLANSTVLSGTTVNLSLGQTKTVYSIGYDTYGNFIGESSLTWTGTNNVTSVPVPRIGSSTTITAVESGTGVLQGSLTPAQITFNVGTGSQTWAATSTDATGKNFLGSSQLIRSIFYDATSDQTLVSSQPWRQGATATSWYSESLTSSIRGSRNEFPAKTFIIATAQGLDIIDATTNLLWMRFIAGPGRAINSDYGSITDVAALEGRVYVAMAQNPGTSGALMILDFTTDEVYQISNTTKKSTLNIANRNASGTLNINTTYANFSTAERLLKLSARRIGGIDYVAIGTLTRALLFRATPGAALSTVYASSSTTGQPITAIHLTSNNKLYFAEQGVKLHRATFGSLPLTANFATSYAYDRNTTNAKIPDLNITSLSISEKVTSSSTHHQLVIGSASGLTTILENPTDTAATSANYNYIGTGALNPSTGTNPFGSGIFQCLGGASAYAEAADNPGLLSGTGTIDLWMRPEAELTLASAPMTLLSKGTTAQNGSFGLQFNTGGNGKIELWVQHSGTTLWAATDTTMTWNKGQWYHIAGVFKPSGLEIYVNGQLEHQNLVSLAGYAVNNQVLRFGGDGTNGFTGALDEVRISNVDQYNGVSFSPSTTAYASNPTNNVYLYHFDANTGITATATQGPTASLNSNCWLSKPLYKGLSTAIHKVAAASNDINTAMTELITSGGWTELTNLQGTPTVNDFLESSFSGTDVFFYHNDGVLTKDIGIIKDAGVDKDLFLKVR